MPFFYLSHALPDLFNDPTFWWTGLRDCCVKTSRYKPKDATRGQPRDSLMVRRTNLARIAGNLSSLLLPTVVPETTLFQALFSQTCISKAIIRWPKETAS